MQWLVRKVLFNLGWMENKHQQQRLTGCFVRLYILVPSPGKEQNPQPPLKQIGLVLQTADFYGSTDKNRLYYKETDMRLNRVLKPLYV